MHRATRRRAVAVLAAGLILATAPIQALAVTPIDAGPVTAISPVDINVDPGDQYDPHVSTGIAAYTAPDGIRYYDFVTGADALVTPDATAVDQLSDVSDGRIVFSRLSTLDFSTKVMVFDTATLVTSQVSPPGDTQHSNSAIGSDTVAYVDTLITSTGELYTASIGSAAVRVTTDGRYDQSPQVAPLGELVVYESCQTTQANCDVRQAAWSGSSWVVTSLTDNAEPEQNPDTDGVVVVYDATRSGERDIYWQHAGGDAEQNLTLAGQQRNPSVSSGVIAFESVAVGAGAADLYVYEVASNRLFEITSTPDNETLNDVDVLNDGRVRVVWASGGAGERNVYGATFQLSPVDPNYSFGGFLSPIEPRPTFNSMKAGAAVPVKFSLGGDLGLAIFADGYPKSQAIDCGSTADVEAVDQTVAAGSSSLSYDPSTGVYTYVWKTEKAWTRTCRQLVLGLMDGSFERANFLFR